MNGRSTLLNNGNDFDSNSLLSIAGMNSLEFRRYVISLSSVSHIITQGEESVSLFSPPITTNTSKIL